MQHPLVAYIDDFNLVRVILTQPEDTLSFEPDKFHIWDEFDNQLNIISNELEPRSIYLTGEFFNWKEDKRGKMLWDEENQFYYCDLPLKEVKNKEFKFIENSCIWHPAGENLKVKNHKGDFFRQGYMIYGDKIRFILKNKMFGFRSFVLILRTRQKFSPDTSYYLNYCYTHKIKLINRDIFNQPEFYYDGNDLGCTWSPQKTVFKLWSPVADELMVHIYNSPESGLHREIIPMTKTNKGVWQAVAEGNWENYYYLYEIMIDNNSWQQIDPYSKALAVNSTHSLIFDESKGFPEGWKSQKKPVLKSPLDAVIYEMHIRDFSVSPTWHGPDNWRGKYQGITWSGKYKENDKTVSIGLDHLKELGVNVLQLLPVFDFNTVDETGKDPEKLRNWGYDPVAYNVPEGSYAQHPEDIRRLHEFRTMIMKLHNEGFKVVMDVVYNHTAHVGAPYSIFDIFIPEYFYRMNNAGHYTNGSGCGNEIASEKPMVRKYIIDSLLYWVKKFNIDGFRFDLMGLIDLNTMKLIVSELRNIKSDILLYGEPWSGGASPLKNPAVKGTQKNLGFAVFNDNFRDSLRGDTDGKAKGWVMGKFDLKDQVIKALMGSIDDFTANPSETINYVSAHDNYTWYDKLKYAMPDASEEVILKTARLGLSIVLTSQGIPFLHAGSEFLRSKRIEGISEEEIRNSYKANDEVNKLDWSKKTEHYHLFDYIRHLIMIRKKYPAFRISNPLEIKKRIIILKNGYPKQIIPLFIDGLNKDTDLLIFYNPTLKNLIVDLPDGIWRIIFDDKFKTRLLQAEHIVDKIKLTPLSITILELD